MTAAGPGARPGAPSQQAAVEAALVLLDRMGLTPAILTDCGEPVLADLRQRLSTPVIGRVAILTDPGEPVLAHAI